MSEYNIIIVHTGQMPFLVPTIRWGKGRVFGKMLIDVLSNPHHTPCHPQLGVVGHDIDSRITCMTLYSSKYVVNILTIMD